MPINLTKSLNERAAADNGVASIDELAANVIELRSPTLDAVRREAPALSTSALISALMGVALGTFPLEPEEEALSAEQLNLLRLALGAALAEQIDRRIPIPK